MKAIIFKHAITLLLPLFVFFLSSSEVTASKWVGDVNSDWYNSANWDKGNIHVNGESLAFGPAPANFPIIASGNIIINSLTLGSNTITQNGGTITVDNLNISAAQGGGKFYQNDGLLIINGNYGNDGGLFESSGGTIQFSLTGGATVNYAGTNIFNNVLIDSGIDPKFDEGNNTIYISGNFTNNNITLDNSQGTLIFNGTGTQVIYSASTSNTFYNLEVDQTNGEIVFTSDVTITNNFANTSGSPVDHTGYDVTAGGGDPLPVELTAFSAFATDENVVLNWETATEVNNYGFEIERHASTPLSMSDNFISGGDIVWEKVAFVEGHGNSNSLKYYSFTDKSIEASGKYSYRLKQIDIDGTFDYSGIVEVIIESPKNYKLSQNYPNPFNPTTSISYSIPNDAHVTLGIYDVLGNEVVKLENGYKSAGTYSYSFDASELSSGLYFYTIRSGKFLETKKMLLMK